MSTPDLQGALHAFYKKLGQLHITFGHATRDLCYQWLSGDWDEDDQNYAGALNNWRDRYPAIAKRFCDLVTQNTPSSQFRAFFDFYVEMVAVGVRRIFTDLMEIGSANETDGSAWAKSRVGHPIRSYRHLVADWVRVACDRHVTNPWQAPLFLTMKPAGCERYDPDRAWERMDAASSLEVLEAFADGYVRKLEDYIEDDAGAAYLAMAKHPRPAGKVIEAKVIEGNELGARKSQADPEAERRQVLIERAKNAATGDAFRKDEAACIFKVSDSTIKYWVKIKKLERGTKHGTITAASIRWNLKD